MSLGLSVWVGACQAAAEKVTVIFSEEELNAVLEDNPSRLIVLEASLSWCRPCRAFTRTYEVNQNPKQAGQVIQYKGMLMESWDFGLALVFGLGVSSSAIWIRILVLCLVSRCELG